MKAHKVFIVRKYPNGRGTEPEVVSAWSDEYCRTPRRQGSGLTGPPVLRSRADMLPRPRSGTGWDRLGQVEEIV